MTSKLMSASPGTEIDPPIDENTVYRHSECIEPGRAAYRLLTGHDPDDASIDTDQDFDAHVLASILAVATTEAGSLATCAGLTADDLDALAAHWFPHARRAVAASAGSFAEDEAATLLRDLLLSYAPAQSGESRWLANMVARRAVEPNHLWEDLGLRERGELTRLLHRHFGPLAERNTNNMRWKRFFYRMLCEDDGFLMCATPVCTECRDFHECFGEESGESRLAQRLRDQETRSPHDSAERSPRPRHEGTIV